MLCRNRTANDRGTSTDGSSTRCDGPTSRSERREGRLRRYQLVNDISLHHRDYPGVLERAADRYLLLELAIGLDVQPTEDELDRARRELLARRSLTEDTLAAWLRDADLDPAGFAELVRQQAVIAWMRRLILDSRMYERSRRMVIEQLQLEGSYPAAADQAARRRKLADTEPTPPYPVAVDQIIALIARQQAVSGWTVDRNLVALADEHGYEGFAGLLIALSDAAAASVAGQKRRRRVLRLLGIDSTDAPGIIAAEPTQTGVVGAAANGAHRVDPTALHGLLEAHQVSLALLAAIELGLPTALANDETSRAGDRTSGTEVAALAEVTGASPALLGRMLELLRTLQLVALDDDRRWRLTELGRWLTPEHPDSLLPYARDIAVNGIPAWQRLAEVIRGAVPATAVDPVLVDEAIAAATGALGFPALIRSAVDFPEGARVIDFGGGLGTFVEDLAAARPDLAITLVELPATAERAAARLARCCVPDRIQVVATDAADSLAPADRCLLQRVLINLDDPAAGALLVLARDLLAADGRVVVVDVEADGSPGTALGDLLNLARTGGRVRSAPEWEALAASAGLRIVDRRLLRRPFSLFVLAPDERSLVPS